MKRIVVFLFFIGALFSMQGKDLKILTIGNSYSICVGKYLPVIVGQSGGNSLMLASMYIGGAGINTHCENLAKAKADSDFKPYKINIWKSSDPFKSKEFKANLLDMISMEKWDVITIQHASVCGHHLSSFEPYSGELIAFIRENAPQAKIMWQQTWSYRKTDPRLANNGGEWTVDSDSMAVALVDTYHQVSERYGIEVIPTGLAVQNWRREAPESAIVYTADELAAFECPDLPKMSGDVVGNYWWEKKNGKMELGADHIHLNERGEYLQACVWFLKLYGGSVDDIKYVPGNMGDDFADLCKRCAQEAIENWK